MICKLLILGTLGMPGYKNDNINLNKPLTFICRQKINFILYIFFEILQTCYFGYFRHAWISTPKVILSTRRKLACLSAGKKSISLFKFFWRYCKDMQTSYFGYFGHAWLQAPKMIVSTCRRLRCLSACQKETSSFTSFLRYYILKNPTI